MNGTNNIEEYHINYILSVGCNFLNNNRHGALIPLSYYKEEFTKIEDREWKGRGKGRKAKGY